MGRIVRNLLTLARFDEGSLRLLRSPVDLRGIAAQATESLASLATERGVSVRVSGDAAPLVADADCLRTVVVNLLENAIKYSGKGSSVSLGISLNANHARLNVSDTGPGIPPMPLSTSSTASTEPTDLGRGAGAAGAAWGSRSPRRSWRPTAGR